MENNRTLKVIVILILLIVAVQFAITLLSRGEANEAIREMKAARESLGKAQENIAEARTAIGQLATDLQSARDELKAIDQQVNKLDNDMLVRIAAVNSQLKSTLSDIRKENETIAALQKKLSTLHDHHE